MEFKTEEELNEMTTDQIGAYVSEAYKAVGANHPEYLKAGRALCHVWTEVDKYESFNYVVAD